ncbi:MAG: DUF1697 domain-containing protein [Candidatus Nanopelagicales bacterium]
MPKYIVLLRGVNVGGNNKLKMADLRSALEAHNFTNVQTYIQSGNIVADFKSSSATTVAREVESVISNEFNLQVPAISVTRSQLLKVAQSNPYPGEQDMRRLHAIFLPKPHDKETLIRIEETVQSVRAKGSNDSLTVIGTIMYLHTPDGFGTSDLAKALTTKSSKLTQGGTARNWATVTTLIDLSA